MTWSKEDRVRELARLVGIPIMEQELSEVANRFESLLGELERLMPLDIADIQPVTIFPEEE
jgi:Asp-tRNA(Asn)/Glu-tRNA(Gln) amidotransferase C subunit